MRKLKIVFANISGGLVWCGKTYGDFLFSRVSLKEYSAYLQQCKPDILSLSEIHTEDMDGHSEMVESISQSLHLPYYTCFSQSSSHLDTSKFLGTAILSIFPITDTQTFILPNPKLEIYKSNGNYMIMFDKGAQKATLDFDGQRIVVVNLHYFPFHHFNRRMNEDEFANIRHTLVEMLTVEATVPTIVTGDFNNKGLPLYEAFPELFTQQRFAESIMVETTAIGVKDQLDHILYSPNTLQVLSSSTEKYISDHYAVIAELALRPERSV